MPKPGIAAIVTGLVLVLTLLCSGAGADQGEALVEAAYRNDLNRVRDLLDQGVDVNAKDKDGVTALWKTALSASHSKESTKMAGFLLDKGADPDFKDTCGRTPLMWASGHGPVELVRLLLDKGADADDGVSLPDAVHNQKNLEVVKLLLDRGAAVNTKTSDGWMALTKAASNNKIEVAKLLLDKGADVNATGRLGWTALMWSIYDSHVGMAKLLLDRGADVNAKTPSGRTALMEAAAADHQIKEAQRQLWDTFCALVGFRQWGPLYPPRMNDRQMVKLLLEHGADVNAKDKGGWTALKRAQKRGAKEIVELLKAHGAKQ